ncbi:MAG: hypothetical protein ACU0CT_15305 [Paracoccaceae bacterium]
MKSMLEAAEALSANPADPAAHLAAARALISALGSGDLAACDPGTKDELYRQLTSASVCPARPPVFAHEVASLISAGNSDVAAKLAAEVLPTLRSLLDSGPQDNPDFKNAVLLILILRTHIGQTIPLERITCLHLTWFTHFAPEDLALPYSTMFNTSSYRANRDEILAAYPPGQPTALEDKAIRPWHVTFFEWLGGKPWFLDTDNAELERFLAARLPSDDMHDMRHARTLVLRHFRPDGRLTPARLGQFGVADVTKHATQLATSRASLARFQTPKRFGARHIQARSYQAVQLARSVVATKLPALNRRQRRLRVAICVSGQLRGYEMALASWRKTLLTAIEPTFFIHSWEAIGRSSAEPFRFVLPFAGTHFPEAYRMQVGLIGYDAAQARYPTLFNHLKGNAIADSSALAALYGSEYVVLENEHGPKFAGFSNQQKMHYKIYAADQMARAAGEFDLFVRIRPDLEVKLAPFDWRDLLDSAQSRTVLYTEKAPSLHYGHLMVGDQFAIAPPDLMEVYAKTWESFSTLAGTAPGGCPAEFTGHVSLALTCWYNGIVMEKAPIRFGKLLEAQSMSSVEICSALENDLSSRRLLDSVDTALLTAVRLDMKA